MVNQPLLRCDPKALWLACIVLYVVLGPTQAPFLTPSLYDNTRLLQIFVLSVLSLTILVLPSLRDGMAHAFLGAPKSVQAALAMFVFLALLSGFHASTPMMAWQEVALFLMLGLLSLSVVALAGASRKALDTAMLAAFEGSVLVFIVVFWMARVAASHMNQPFEWIHPFISFANVRHFSQFQAYTLPLLVVPLLGTRLAFRWRAAAFLIAAHWWALQFAVGTRAIWVATASSATILLLILRRGSFSYLMWLGFAIAGGGLLYLSLSLDTLGDAPGLSEIARRGFDSSNRWALWSTALAMAREYPAFGVGPMHFSFRNFDWAAHPHNSVLQLAAEYGLPATTIMLTLVACLLWKCTQWAECAQGEEDRSLNVAVLGALLTGLMDSLASGNTLMPVSQVTLSLLVGWVVGRNLRHSPALHLAARRPIGLTLAMLSLAGAITISSGALAYYRYWEARQFVVPAGASHPRYWEEGHWPRGGPTMSADRR